MHGICKCLCCEGHYAKNNKTEDNSPHVPDCEGNQMPRKQAYFFLFFFKDVTQRQLMNALFHLSISFVFKSFLGLVYNTFCIQLSF